MKPQKKVTLVGPFSDDDLATIMEVLRYCERKQPEENFFLTIESNDDRPIEDVKQFLQDRFPAVKGVPVDMMTFNTGKDDTSP